MDNIKTKTTRRARRNTGRLTLSDLAEMIGVTKVTVSRALNHPDLVSAETLEKVRSAVAETGYTPDLLAGSLASSRSKFIVALIPAIGGSVFQETIEALTQTLAQQGYQLLIGQSGYDDAREDALIDTVVGSRPAGIVLTGVMHSAHARRKLLASGIPVVETWGVTQEPIDMLVGFSHQKVGRAAAKHLQAQGVKYPAIITPRDRRALTRAEAFTTAYAGHAAYENATSNKRTEKNRTEKDGHDKKHVTPLPMVAVDAPANLGDGRRALSELLDLHPQIDGVFCVADILGLGVLIEARHRGIAVPSGLKVLGYGDPNFAKDTDPPLTTIRIDGTRIGTLAASLLIERIVNPDAEQRVVDVGFALIQRETC